MFHNQASRKKQQGSLIIVIVFVLVVMGFLATSLSRIELSNSDAHTKDVMGTQASLLAFSATESALSFIYPLREVTDPALNSISERCDFILSDIREYDFDTTVSCEPVAVTCGSRGGQLDDGTQMFVVTAVATCGTGLNSMQRRQEAWVRGE